MQKTLRRSFSKALLSSIMALSCALVLVHPDARAQYCLPTYVNQFADCTNGYGMWILNFKFAGIDNTSPACSVGYTDFTGVSTSVIPGQTYDVSIAPGSTIYPKGYSVWIDLNNDKIFQNPEERVFFAPYSYNNPQTGKITIPVTATPGVTRLRVRSSYQNNGDIIPPCGEDGFIGYGEGEDYTITIIAGIESSFPDAVVPNNILKSGAVYDNTTHADGKFYPKPSVSLRQSVGSSYTLTYKIVGPLPSTNVIYEARQGGNPNIVVNPTTNGLTTYTFSEAVPLPSGKTDGTLDLTTISGGTYRVIATHTAPASGTREWIKDFSIAKQRDMSTLSIIAPYTNIGNKPIKYPLGIPIAISARFQNSGLDTVQSFDVTATVYKGTTPVYTQTKTLTNQNLPTGSVVNYDFPAFTPPGDKPGVYTLNVCTRLLTVKSSGQEVTAQDLEPLNDCLPRATDPAYTFENQYEVEISADAITKPSNGFSICVGHPFQPVGVFGDRGVADYSNTPVRMKIYDASNQLVYNQSGILPDLTAGSNSSYVFPPFIPLTAGSHRAELIVDFPAGVDPVPENNVISSFFSIGAALTGEHKVGVGQEFQTIQDAVDALYTCSVQGPVTFILMDANYTVSSSIPSAPALDMTGRMVGISASSTITWVPSDARKNTRGGVTITLQSASGIGMRFGQNLFPINNNAVVKEFSTKENANPSGYMTWDGGENKAIRLRLLTTAPLSTQRAVVYIGRGASNYAIKNCLIENAPGSVVSYATNLPKQKFTAPSAFFYENDVTNNLSYSAGVVIRNTAPVNLNGNNGEGLDTLLAGNNVISGNEISGFGYGVVSLGNGTLFSILKAKFTEYYNSGNEISNNTIWNVARAGVYAGYEKNEKIMNNRIYNVGTVVGYTGSAAGIMAGGDTRYNNMNLSIVGNEISGVSSPVEAAGILVEQVLTQYLALDNSPAVNYPSGNVSMQSYNNTIWGLSRSGSGANLAGIHYMTSRSVGATGTDALVKPASVGYMSEGDMISNNTIVIGNDNINGTGAIAGIGLQQSKGAQMYNNAVAVTVPTSASNLLRAGVLYEGVLPGDKGGYGLLSDYNVLYVPNGAMVYMVETSQNNDILSLGDMNQFKTLAQWRALSKQDRNSYYGDFTGDLSYSGLAPIQKLRVRSNPVPQGSLLNNRGKRLSVVTTDIDNQTRGEAEQPYDIGADEFAGTLYASDLEMLEIISPQTYKRESGLFSEAEYVMSRGAVSVTARIRNSGSLPQSGVDVTTTIYNEGNAVVAKQTRKVSAKDGNVTELTFDFSGGFTPQSYCELGLAAPSQFAVMSRNATPVYTIVVQVSADQNSINDKVSKAVRFYKYGSKTGIMVSVEGSNISSPVTANDIAARLNSDSLQAGLSQMSWNYMGSSCTGDYDLLERSAWEPYSVDYSQYRTLLWSEDGTGLSRLERDNVRGYLSSGTPSEKKNMIIGSQDVAKVHNGSTIDKDQGFVNQVLRAQWVNPPGQPLSPDYNLGKITGVEIGKGYTDMLKNTGYAGDANPKPALLKVYSDATTQGVARTAYRYVTSQVSADGMGTYVRALNYNVTFYGVDWRHISRTSGDAMSGVSRLLKAGFDGFNGEWILPVELSDFRAERKGREVVSVRWSSSSERNSSYYEVQRKIKGSEVYSSVGQVSATGQSSEAKNYSLQDNGVKVGNAYSYRLRMVDIDGSSSYSQEVEVSLLESESGNLWVSEASPNPVKGENVNLSYRLSEGSAVSIGMYSLTGQKVWSTERNHSTGGSYSIGIDMEKLNSGWYMVVVKAGNEQMSRRVYLTK